MPLVTRRQFLRSTLVSFILLWGQRLFAKNAPEQTVEKNYPAFIDTLIPQDDKTPSASQLGVDQVILSEIRPQASRWNLCLLAIASLNKASHKSFQRDFAELSDSERESMLKAWLSQYDNDITHRFFIFHRQRAMQLYYAQAVSWPGLGFQQPPQPSGYPDYHLPPDTMA